MKSTAQSIRFSDKFTITDLDTWKFVLLTIGTVGMWHSFWLYTFSESLNKNEKRTAIHLEIPIIAMVVASYSGIFSEIPSRDKESAMVLFLLTSVYVILELCISFMSKPVLEKMLAENGTPRRLNGFLCFLLPGFYQYYVIRKAEEHFSNEDAIRISMSAQATTPVSTNVNKIEQIEKLAELKKSGAIIDEEFVTEKKRILSEENQ